MDSRYQPLADEIRPRSLDDVVGQQHILGRNGLLRRIVESGSTPNMIFYGPSGTGKTTVARIIAERTQRSLRKLNATTAGIADIKRIIDELDTFLTPGGVLLYLDEIQYFNKKQQQSLLEFIEDGRITLIASTTENPYFCVFGAILSRSTVFEFKPVSAADAEQAVLRAIDLLNARREKPLEIESGVVRRIAASCGGDVRKAINAVELLFSACGEEGVIRLDDAVLISQKSAMRYDRDGDEHFDILSAMMKSLRGSAGGFSARPARISVWPIRRPCRLSRPAWTARCSSACRKRGCRWRRPASSWQPHPSPTAWSWPSTRPSAMCVPARSAASRASCRTSMPTVPALNASRAICIPTNSPATGCVSSTCPTN